MSSSRLRSPAGTRRTANRSKRKQTPKNSVPLPKKKKKRKKEKSLVLCCHSNPKSNALSGFLSVKSADLYMMSAVLLLSKIKVLFLKSWGSFKQSLLALVGTQISLAIPHVIIKSIGKRTL